jgi:rod shape-determining protein MreC
LKQRHIILLFLFVILPALILLNATPLYSILRNISVAVFEPFFEKAYFIVYNFKDGLERISTYPNLTKINAQLESENLRLRRAVVDFNEIAAENTRLKALLEITDQNLKYEKCARVIGRDISLWTNTFIIDVGSDDGIYKDTPIVSPAGLVGKVGLVGKNSSRCLMLIDRRSKVSSLIQRTRDIGIIEGTDDGLLKMRYLSIKADVLVGDEIITSGLGGIFPKGIPIGTVITVGKETNGLHLFASIRPFVDFNKLEEVICLKE